MGRSKRKNQEIIFSSALTHLDYTVTKRQIDQDYKKYKRAVEGYRNKGYVTTKLSKERFEDEYQIEFLKEKSELSVFDAEPKVVWKELAKKSRIYDEDNIKALVSAFKQISIPEVIRKRLPELTVEGLTKLVTEEYKREAIDKTYESDVLYSLDSTTVYNALFDYYGNYDDTRVAYNSIFG